MIKWEDYEIGVTGLMNQIVIGKSKPLVINGKSDPSMRQWTDRSKDKTEQAINAVMQHLLNKARENGATEYSIEIRGMAKLTITDMSGKEEINE